MSPLTAALSSALHKATGRVEELMVQACVRACVHSLHTRARACTHTHTHTPRAQDYESRTAALSSALRTATGRVEELMAQLQDLEGGVRVVELEAEQKGAAVEAHWRAQLEQVSARLCVRDRM